MQQKFMQDLQKIYDELESRQRELNDYYKLLEGGNNRAKKVIEEFLKEIGLPYNDETVMASLVRIVNLREDALEQILLKEGFTQNEIIEKKEIAYQFVKDMYLLRHEYFIAWIEIEGLLTPFYQILIEGVHNIGEAISKWQSSWTARIINGINRELLKEYNGDEKAILKMLQNNNLLDIDPNGNIGDRCYSVLEKDKDIYKSVAYSNAFPKEVGEVVSVIEDCIENLSLERDEVFNQKEAWIEYLVAIKKAFSVTEPKKLIGYWANVDRAWMKITTPIQIGHPLEYYEDHFRKAVALEWDLRVVNPKLQDNSKTRESIREFAIKLSNKLKGDELENIVNKNISEVDNTQLYIGKPMLYYGAEFNGLFSAQVVPNDEQVSIEFGKKIFAYADFVLESKRAKPIMQLSVETFGIDFVKKQKNLVENSSDIWYKIYDISTIGHEFGHILWVSEDTETIMNVSGEFKNIEEFKATTGGIMAFFHNEKEELIEHIIDDLVSRAIGLISWREVGEVLPYYCEGLIHLDLLFKSGIIKFNDRVEINYNRYLNMKEIYQKAYIDLAQHYINKLDANIYLSKYIKKDNGIYLPKDDNILNFVEKYYIRYKEIGQQIYRV